MSDFVDYYEILQISPNAEAQTVSRVYKMLATRYHPDNPVSGDPEMFLRLQEAYEVLSDAGKREAYNGVYEIHRLKPLPIFETPDFFAGVDAEHHRRIGILCLLYNNRRSSPDRPGLSVFELEQMMAIPREHLEFTIWYLREKAFIRCGDNGDLVITSEGVDYVESKRPHNEIVFKLLKTPEMSAGSDGSDGMESSRNGSFGRVGASRMDAGFRS